MVMLPTKESTLFSRSDQMFYREGLLLNSLVVFTYVLDLSLQNERFPCSKGLCAFHTQTLYARGNAYANRNDGKVSREEKYQDRRTKLRFF